MGQRGPQAKPVPPGYVAHLAASRALRAMRPPHGVPGGVVSGRPTPCPRCGARLFLEPQTERDASPHAVELLCLACGYRVAAV